MVQSAQDRAADDIADPLNAAREGGTQGNRVKKSTPDETCQIVVVPRGDKAAGLQGILLAGGF